MVKTRTVLYLCIICFFVTWISGLLYYLKSNDVMKIYKYYNARNQKKSKLIFRDSKQDQSKRIKSEKQNKRLDIVKPINLNNEKHISKNEHKSSTLVSQLAISLREPVLAHRLLINDTYSAMELNRLYANSVKQTRKNLPFFLPYDPDFNVLHTFQLSESYYEMNQDLNHPILYGYFTYTYLDGYLPPIYEQKDVNIPEHYYSNLPTTDQIYHFQERYSYLENNKVKYSFRNTTYSLPRNRHYSFLSLPYYDKKIGLFNPYKIVIVLKSVYSRIQMRTVVRHTYGNTSLINSEYGPIKVFFVMGIPENKPETRNLLLEEQRYYNDLIITNIVESYQNLTLKTMMVEDLFISMKSRTPFYITGDDDTCIDIRKIAKILQHKKPHKLSYGRVIKGNGQDKGLYKMHVTTLEAIPHAVNFPMGLCSVSSKDILNCRVKQYRKLEHLSHIDDLQRGYLNEICDIKTASTKLYFGTDNDLKRLNKSITRSPYYAVHGNKNKIEFYGLCMHVLLDPE